MLSYRVTRAHWFYQQAVKILAPLFQFFQQYLGKITQLFRSQSLKDMIIQMVFTKLAISVFSNMLTCMQPS